MNSQDSLNRDQQLVFEVYEILIFTNGQTIRSKATTLALLGFLTEKLIHIVLENVVEIIRLKAMKA